MPHLESSTSEIVASGQKHNNRSTILVVTPDVAFGAFRHIFWRHFSVPTEQIITERRRVVFLDFFGIFEKFELRDTRLLRLRVDATLDADEISG